MCGIVGMIGIGTNQALRCPAVLIQPENNVYEQVDHPLGKLGNQVHSSGGGINDLVPFGIVDHLHDFLMVCIHSILGVKFEIGQALFRVVIKFLFDGKGNGDVVFLVKLAVADKAVHPGPQNKGLFLVS